MKRVIIVLAVLSITVASTVAFAQPDSRDIGVFSDRSASSSGLTAFAFVPFFFYVLGWDLDGSVLAFEFSLNVPIDLLVLARTFDGPWLNVGSLDNFIVGTGACLPGDGVWFNLVGYQAGYFVPVPPNDQLICVGPSSPSSFNPAQPGYLQCDRSLVTFGIAQNGGNVYPDGCAVVNATSPTEFPIANDQNTFGSFKSRY